jgi:hypothetical protein
MKKEKSAVAAEGKASLAALTKLEGEVGADIASPPPIKADPDGPPSVKNNSVNGETNCDTESPRPPSPAPAVQEGGEGGEDLKPGLDMKLPSNCNNGGQAADIKSETDNFLDTFDSKDGGKADKSMDGKPGSVLSCGIRRPSRLSLASAGYTSADSNTNRHITQFSPDKPRGVSGSPSLPAAATASG